MWMERKGTGIMTGRRSIEAVGVLLVCMLALGAVEARAGLLSDFEWVEDGSDAWSMITYSGKFTTRTFGRTVFNIPGKMKNNYIHAVGLNRRLATWSEHFSLEAEGLVAFHHGRHRTGRQKYQEFVGCFLVRYHRFPWDRFIDTTIALGEGMSLTTHQAKIEIQENSRDKTKKFLNYLAVEATFALPQFPNTALVYRIHHRSGIFGLMGVHGVSDFYCLGVRHRF